MLRRLLGIARQAPELEHRIRFGDAEFSCSESQSLLDAALDAGVPVAYSCQVGACGTCRCQVLSGKFRTERSLSYAFSAEELRLGYTLACQTRPEADLVVAVDGPTQEARVKSCSLVGESVAELRLELEAPLVYQLGQFCHLTVPGSQITRPFSMTALDGVRDDELVFHVKLRPGGAMSCWLSEQVGQPGASLRVSRPQGEVSRLLNRTFTRVLCLAGGSGLGVAASVGLELGSSNRAQRIDFLTINRNGVSEYHRRVIERVPQCLLGQFALNIPYARFVECEAAVVEQLSQELATCPDSLAVVCGSNLIVERGHELLRSAGLDQARILVIPFESTTTVPVRAELGSS